MQGIASLPYEVTEQPNYPTGGINSIKHAADMMADFGRHGDTYIVHAAEGETVVPVEVIEANPRMKRMIHQQMEEMGLDPQRYIVGTEYNSINPVTGRPEFFLKKIGRAVKKHVKRLGKIAKKLAPIVLPIAAPFMFPLMPVAFSAGIGSLVGGMAGGMKFKDALKSAAITAVTAGAGQAMRGRGFLGSMSGTKQTLGQGLRSMVDPATYQLQNPVKTFSTLPQRQFNNQQKAQFQQQAQQSQMRDQAIGSGARISGTPPTSASLAGQMPQPAPIKKDYLLQSEYAGYPAMDQDFVPGSDTEIRARDAIARHEGTLGPEMPKTINTASSEPSFYDKYISPDRHMYDLDPVTGQPKYVVKAQQLTNAEYGNLSRTDPVYLEAYKSNLEATRPGAFTSQAPRAAVIATGVGIADKKLGTNLIFPSGVDEDTQTALGPSGEELYTQDPGMYGFDYDRFIGRNPYYAAQEGGEIVGPGTGTSDSIPALLSDGEFVVTAEAVRNAGGGDRRAGAQRMYDMMKRLEQGGTA